MILPQTKHTLIIYLINGRVNDVYIISIILEPGLGGLGLHIARIVVPLCETEHRQEQSASFVQNRNE